MASVIGLNNNSDDSDSENVVTQDEEVTITKKKIGEGKTFFFQRHLHLLSWQKRQLKRKKHGHGRLKRSKKH
jgi:hypothetical protein